MTVNYYYNSSTLTERVELTNVEAFVRGVRRYLTEVTFEGNDSSARIGGLPRYLRYHTGARQVVLFQGRHGHPVQGVQGAAVQVHVNSSKIFKNLHS